MSREVFNEEIEDFIVYIQCIITVSDFYYFKISFMLKELKKFMF